jgi:hypothetical protein
MTSTFSSAARLIFLLRVTKAAIGASALLSVGGCNAECGDSQTIRYDCEDCGMTDEAGTFYQSSPITGPLLHFPPQRTYELVHRLNGIPGDIDISLSFRERGSADHPLNLSPSAGNQSIYSVNPEAGTITVTNDVCAEFYLYVTARVTPSSTTADGG